MTTNGHRTSDRSLYRDDDDDSSVRKGPSYMDFPPGGQDPYGTGRFDDENGELGPGPPSPAKCPSGMFSQCRPCRGNHQDDELVISGARQAYDNAQPGQPRDPRHGSNLLRIDSLDDDDYVLMEDDDEQDAAALVEELKEMEKTNSGLRRRLYLLASLVIILSSIVGTVLYHSLGLDEEQQQQVSKYALLASIPVVACLFTWFHIWLAIQMMFRPLKFHGIYEFGNSGMGIGWQGIVPRKAGKMARDSYKYARPYLDGPRDWLSRIDAKRLVEEIRPKLLVIIKDSFEKVCRRHFPVTRSRLPKWAVQKTCELALDDIQETSPDLWMQFTDLVCDPKIGIDNDGMIVKVFTESKELLNSFFLTLGKREFKFIEHCGAAMGFVCGLVQLIAFNNLGPVGRAVFLPTTGFVLGIVSNWAAIMCVFKPCFPHPVKIFGCQVCVLQGLFLKRQPEVALLYSKLLCEHFLSFSKVIRYLETQEELWQKLKETYVAHNTKVLHEAMGVSATWLAPLALGKDQYAAMEEDLKKSLVKGLGKATDIHKIGGKYIAKASNIEENNCAALRKMPPDQFEDLLHPVFQEDEWILILLGGILGAIVGIAQVFFLKV